jgi:hypothetical protein
VGGRKEFEVRRRLEGNLYPEDEKIIHNFFFLWGNCRVFSSRFVCFDC